ncbi:MAG: selenocysteine-specific translation elongation factor [Desulfuromonas sp.]|nr:MAG: selenocysteine-specific translation elongation factor [Desulfuromonas sp.]
MSKTTERHLIIGTAGHVDHGKTTLIRALTGAETDRLKEEKERGISIDLGFAPFRLPKGGMAGIVDVPGHERFIHNMLAGVGGIDMVLLLLDVMEGVMPQTREHLAILKLLDVQRGIVVLSKCDLADPDWVDLVEEEIREEVAETFLKDAPFCRVSALTGDGIPDLIATIEEVARAITPKDADGPLRLPIDRHFTVAGFGTVVTGTLLSGRIRTGETVEMLPPGETVRVRELQVHGKKVEEASAGQRAALNLVGLDRERIQRGAVVGTPGIFEMTERFDARLTLLPEAPRPLKFRDPVHLYLGTARVVGMVALLDRDILEPGESAIVQIHLDRPLVAHRQDRFIIRSYSPMTTIGGGVVVDPAPVKHKRFRDDVMASLKELESGEKSFLLQKLAAQPCLRLKEFEQLAAMGRERIGDHLEALQNEGRVALLADQWVVVETLRSWRRRLIEEVEQFHKANPLLLGIPRATLKGALPAALLPKGFDALLAAAHEENDLVAGTESVHLPGFSPQPEGEQARLIEQIENAYRQDGVLVKNRQEMLDRLGLDAAASDECFAYLFATGRLVRLSEESFLHRDAYNAALSALIDHFNQQKTLTLAEFRDRIGSARKQTQALLEYWDSLKYTLRQGDARVGWKLPTAPPAS